MTTYDKDHVKQTARGCWRGILGRICNLTDEQMSAVNKGVPCPKCGGVAYWALRSRRLLECTSCGHQVSITVGTVMHRTRTPLLMWFWAAYLVSTATPGISARQLGRQLGPRACRITGRGGG